MRRCRRNALDQNTEPLPIFSPLDQIQDCTNCTLGDFCFVDKDIEILDPIKYARLLPYTGPRWYWKNSVKFMLDQGIVRWSHIKYTLTATSHIPHDFFRHIFETMETTQANVRTRDLDGIEPEKFSKECINSLLGLWSKTYVSHLHRRDGAVH